MQAHPELCPRPQPERASRGAIIVKPARWRRDPRVEAAERQAILQQLATEAGQRRFLALVEGRQP